MKIWLVSDYTHCNDERAHRAFYTRYDAIYYLKSLVTSDSDVVDEYLDYVKKTIPESHLKFYDWVDVMCDAEGEEFHLWDYSVQRIELSVSEGL